MLPAKVKDLTGKTFGRLVVGSFDSLRSPHGAFWNCRCICGGSVTVRADTLKSGFSQSCGCLAREVASRCHLKHGHWRGGTSSKTYKSWNGMHSRCSNPKSIGYADYGGRGIRVCERWRSFENFLTDMGEAPQGMSIDRINNDGDYEPSNCRWATMAMQNRNSRQNVIVEVDGVRMCMIDWSNRLGLSDAVFRAFQRRHGGSITDAVRHYLSPDYVRWAHWDEKNPRKR